MNPDDFEEHYRAAGDGDPWAFATSPYEQGRYERTIGCLDRARYRRAFEPGCSIGELTVRLAARCDEVVAFDPAPTALAVARTRLRDTANVELSLAAIPDVWPRGQFELIVLSELGYYFDAAELARIVERVRGSLVSGGQLLAVHWRGHSADHILHGDTVHDVILETLERAPVVQLDMPEFVAGRWDLP